MIRRQTSVGTTLTILRARYDHIKNVLQFSQLTNWQKRTIYS